MAVPAVQVESSPSPNSTSEPPEAIHTLLAKPIHNGNVSPTDYASSSSGVSSEYGGMLVEPADHELLDAITPIESSPGNLPNALGTAQINEVYDEGPNIYQQL